MEKSVIMKINWITREANWAFHHLCKHIAAALTEHRHEFNGKECDIQFVCSPAHFKHGVKADNKTVLHVDSNRWYEEFFK